MKTIYEKPEIKLLYVDSEDIVTTSVEGGNGWVTEPGGNEGGDNDGWG